MYKTYIFESGYRAVWLIRYKRLGYWCRFYARELA